MKALEEVKLHQPGAIEERLSPTEFLKMQDTSNDKILQVDIIPPRLGGGDFGRIRVLRRDDQWIYGIRKRY